MIIYEITTDDGQGYVRCITCKREDAAQLQLERAIYDAAEAQGLRDRPSAHNAMKRAKAWTKRHPIPTLRIGSYTITISADRLPT